MFFVCFFIKVNCSETSGMADGKNAQINRSNFVLSYVLIRSKNQCVELSESIVIGFDFFYTFRL